MTHRSIGNKTRNVLPNQISISEYFDYPPSSPAQARLLLRQMIIANYTLGARRVKATVSHNMLLGCLHHHHHNHENMFDKYILVLQYSKILKVDSRETSKMISQGQTNEGKVVSL